MLNLIVILARISFSNGVCIAMIFSLQISLIKKLEITKDFSDHVSPDAQYKDICRRTIEILQRARSFKVIAV